MKGEGIKKPLFFCKKVDVKKCVDNLWISASLFITHMYECDCKNKDMGLICRIDILYYFIGGTSYEIISHF